MANHLLSGPLTGQPCAQPQPRTGIFLCDCGGQVADMLDMEGLAGALEGLPGVAHLERRPYWCSSVGRQALQAAVRGDALQCVVVAGCSPRTHRRLFQQALGQAGLNPDLLGMVNIREGCAWPHHAERRAATLRARDQVAMEVAHLAALAPRPPAQAGISPQALVIGAGVSGMTAALALADAGVPVTLVERSAQPGGAALAAAPDLVADLSAAVQHQPRIRLLLGSRISRVDGPVGAYRVEVTTHPSPVTQPGPFGAIIVATGSPDSHTTELARWLRLPQDTQGYLPEWRVRLRPGSFIQRGIYVCGAAHAPCDVTQAQFQAYSAASRALCHLRQGSITAHGPAAQVDADKCNGCGDCFTVCPFAAVSMVARPAGLSLSAIDPLLCTGCGNCVSVCPVGAVEVAGWTDAQLEVQMQVALGGPSRLLVFACEWSGYAAAELAGARRLAYPPHVRLIRLGCSGRLQPGLILKAFELGAAGVLVLGCPPKLCHYEQGNQRAAAAHGQVEALTHLLGLPSVRLGLAWVPPDDGAAFAELVTAFAQGLEAWQVPAVEAHGHR